jgi:hypothetical protein
MWKLLALIIGAASAQTPPSYLIYPDQATCLQRSQQMCAAMGCDGVLTKYWWDCTTGPLSSGLVGPNAVPAGSYAMRIESTGNFSIAASNQVSGGTQGLTTQEQGKLVTSTQIAPLLPTVNQQAVAH